MKTLQGILIVMILLVCIPVMSQSPKKLFGNAEKLLKENKVDEAIEQLNLAIQGDEKFLDAYLLRASALEKTAKFDLAVKDYEKSTQLDAKSPDNFYNTGRLYFKLEDYKTALRFLNEAFFLDSKHQAALQYKIFTLIKLSDFQNAIVDCNKAIALNKKNHVIFYSKGVALDSLNDYNNAEQEYQNAINLNAEYVKAYNALVRVKLKKGNIEEAFALANKAVEKFPNDVDVYLTRSIIYRQRTDYGNAINDLTKALNIQPDDKEILLTRGQYYGKFNQYQNAVSDFSRLITLDPASYKAYLWRASANEELMKTPEAIADYEKFMALTTGNNSQNITRNDVEKKLFELKRENQPPQITFTDSIVGKDKIYLRRDAGNFKLSGIISDASNIKLLKVNDKVTQPGKNEKGQYTFNLDITIDTKDVAVEAIDVYDNIAVARYSVFPVEIDAPMVSFITPFATDNGIIYLNSADPQLYFEGVIADESPIKSLTIDGQPVAFQTDKINPTFSGTMNMQDKQSITIVATDIYRNTSSKTYQLNREAVNISQNNPMGKTWVVFIENSNYESFASIEGPTKDVVSMKTALANYQIHNIIHKKDMNKKDMEKFFSLELRDLVRANNVNSLLVWYAGHGKFINETGYWIPVDAKRDDEFTYFPINSLKAGMQAYSKYITHVLVVTDACESGPSFYQAMRSAPTEKQCGDWNAAKFKSSQVFSSAGYELASDDSKFTKTFAKSLQFNSNTCIPIETIVIKVTEAVGQVGKQRPQFGKIQGFEDEDGTFFFMKKE